LNAHTFKEYFRFYWLGVDYIRVCAGCGRVERLEAIYGGQPDLPYAVWKVAVNRDKPCRVLK
jgi:hypothetical protein